MDSQEATEKTLEFSARLQLLLIVHALLPLGWGGLQLFDGMFAAVMIAVNVYQYGLMGLWTGLGPWPGEVRVAGAVFFNMYMVFSTVLIGAVAAGHGPSLGGRSVEFALIVVGCLSGACIVPYLALNPWLTLLRAQDPLALDREYVSSFGIRHLLGITFCYGVVVAATGALKDGATLPVPVAFVILLGPLITGLIALTWAVLTPRFAWIKLVIAILVNGFAAVLMIVRFEAEPVLLGLALPGLAIFVASLFVLRSDGYRLVRRLKTNAHGDTEFAKRLAPAEMPSVSTRGPAKSNANRSTPPAACSRTRRCL